MAPESTGERETTHFGGAFQLDRETHGYDEEGIEVFVSFGEEGVDSERDYDDGEDEPGEQLLEEDTKIFENQENLGCS